MKRLLALVAPAALALALAGCPGPKPDGGGDSPSGDQQVGTGKEAATVEGKYGGKMTVASLSDPKTFNPWVSTETSSTDILEVVFESLNERNRCTLKFEPRLAELPEISPDNLTYTYKL